MIKRCGLLLAVFTVFQFPLAADLKRDAEQALEKAVKFFNSISVEGGYVYYVSTDLSQRWGEEPVDEHTIEVQSPGTPAVGLAFLRAYQVTEYMSAMRAAKAAASALIRGQNDFGGWGHVIRFNQPVSKIASFDDNQTQLAVSFLMALEQKFADKEVSAAIGKALNLMTGSQLHNGGWPHYYPAQGNYHDYATFTDEGINNCIRVMIEADKYYTNSQIKLSLHKAGRFIMRSQLAPPQPGWAQQYNEFLQPAWARSFEPPSVCPLATLNNLNSLMDLAVYFNNRDYLEPIHDALRWLDDTQLSNGLWPRFVELGTGKALYYDRGRIRVDSLSELSEERRLGYGYEIDLSERLAKTRNRFQLLWSEGRELDPSMVDLRPEWRSELETKVKAVIEALDSKGRWVTKDDRFKKQVPGQTWNGTWEVRDRISSQVFIDNVETLAGYLDLFGRRMRAQ